MRIYFVGSHSCGKSTLARYVSEQYKLPMIKEVARMVLSERELHIDSLRANIDLVDSYQSEVFHRQISEEKKFESFVSDRSLLDNLAYSAQHSKALPVLLAEPMFKHYVERLNQQDTIIFFVRPTKATLKNDGVRESLTWDGIIAIDAMIKLLLEMFNIKYFQINTDNMQERIKLIDAVL